jgi:SAM-dependent methyltransferase
VRGLLIATFGFGIRLLRRATHALGMGILGTLRRAELQQAIANGWRRYGQDGAGGPAVLADWESEFYDAQLEPASRVLLVGCGAGRDLIALSERGHQVDGLDIERSALAVCRAELQRRGLRATLYEGAVGEARIESQYDAALFSWYAYGYVPGADARVATLARLRERLRARGRVLLTYQPRADSGSRIPIALARSVARLTRSDWTPEHGDFVELLQDGRERALHFEHRFTASEVVDEAHRAGLRVHWHEHAREGRLVLVRE